MPGLTHRYVDKALFLALDTCPVYCRFCTRSYAVGIDTEEVEKFHLKVNAERWQRAFDYIRSRPELEDIVISGGDAYQLRAEQITQIGETLLRDRPRPAHALRDQGAGGHAAEDPHRRRLDRRAHPASSSTGASCTRRWCCTPTSTTPTRSPAITKAAMDKLFERGITVRNQSVLQRGVNDSVDTMKLLVKRLGHVNVHPYYVYMHDLVKGVEDLRTTLQTGLDIEKDVRGATAGFNTPTFVVDAPGRRRQARRALVRALRPRRPASRSTPRPPSSRARSTSTSIRSTCCPPRASPLGRPRRAPEDGRRGPRRRAHLPPLAPVPSSSGPPLPLAGEG